MGAQGSRGLAVALVQTNGRLVLVMHVPHEPSMARKSLFQTPEPPCLVRHLRI